MQNNNSLDIRDKQHIDEWLKSDAGKKFFESIRDAYDSHLVLAQNIHTKLQCPNEQISVQVSMAAGIKEIIDFVEAIQLEVKEHKKEVEEQSEP